ncbi:MAG: GNAT family N-acetyltransferase [Leptolinea sp.]|jgi:ribosomal protein S18 acetylase RimI-like enzyme|nr:GNAT family N-acetyltransferase [Leptolinea sp.]
MVNLDNVIIRGFQTLDERASAARLMMKTDPWKTFGRSYEQCLDAVSNPQKESYGAFCGENLSGLLVIDLTGPMKGYLQAVCVDESARGGGLGSKLIRFAEERVFSVSPNCFLCYSDFNSSVRPIYEHLGYEEVGVLREYMIPGHNEILMRKTIGPVMRFRGKGS